jgi:pimeloyl-ACP methyl ester carboxylesterase
MMIDFLALDAARLGLAGPRISFARVGEAGPPVLLLHGIGANFLGWRHIMDGLAPHARVLAWNAPGYFLSDPLIAAAPMPEAYADVALALLDALGFSGPVHVVGSSFGSMLGACFAARHPGRVATLTLLGTSRGQRWKTAEQRAGMLAMRTASIAEGGVALARGRSHALIALGSPPAVLGEVQRMVAATDATGLLAAAACTDGVDVVADYGPRIAAPTLAVTGALDGVNPPDVGRAVAAAIPGARFECPPGLGHLPEIEAPEFTLSLLKNHLKLG